MAGVRTVPIHEELAPTKARLVEASTDDFVLSGLAVNRNGDRRDPLGKRFTRLKRAMGFDDRYVFHSIRKTVVTILENAGVAENITADIVGHAKRTMTYGTYSGGVGLEMKRAALGPSSDTHHAHQRAPEGRSL